MVAGWAEWPNVDDAETINRLLSFNHAVHRPDNPTFAPSNTINPDEK